MPTQTPPIKPINPLNKTSFIAKKAISVSIIAVVISAVAIVLAAINYQTAVNHDKDLQTTFQTNLKTQNLLTSLNQDWTNQSEEIKSLHDQILKLKTDQNAPLKKTLAETSYLLHLANLNLSIGKDKDTALVILKSANTRLDSVTNTAFLPLKQSLSEDIKKLESTESVDTNKTFKEISEISSKIKLLTPFSINSMPPASHDKNISAKSDGNKKWYQEIWGNITEIKNVFTIHKIENPSAPVTEPSKIFYIKENIEIKLNIAQWALLNQNETIYKNSLQTVKSWLETYFSMQQDTSGIINKITEIENISIKPNLPSLNNTIQELNQIDFTPASDKTNKSTIIKAEPKNQDNQINPKPSNGIET